MDPQSLLIVFRMTERILGVILGGVLIYFGYRLFLDFRGKRDGSGDFKIAGSRLKISKVGPGVFFSLFGTGLIAFSFLRPVSLTTSPAQDTPAKGPQPAVASVQFLGATDLPDAAARRARLREARKPQIAVLNRALANPSPAWSAKERADLERTVGQVKLALMEAVWTDDWGDLADFRDWVEKQGTVPEGTAAAVAYFQHR